MSGTGCWRGVEWRAGRVVAWSAGWSSGQEVENTDRQQHNIEAWNERVHLLSSVLTYQEPQLCDQ